MAYTPTYVAGDIPAIGVDALGTTGAAVVGWLPLIVAGGVLYGGAKYGKKKYDSLKKESKKPKKSMVGKGWHRESYRHSLAAKGINISKYRRY